MSNAPPGVTATLIVPSSVRLPPTSTTSLSGLPGALAAQAQPGPVDMHGWTVLAANAAVAAKLRQLVPLFVARLTEHGFSDLPLRVKVQNHRA